ncbi:hypothetical protein MtrunA17_Chr3g0141591 [Medicago truncatula]|uniref:Uncharacterized protein n=1 Tax=Medicago truncatula TaxID=3880 RepID=A0A396J3J4_MEDTR|nr:hypothetical protein MtrunA17_Chr3g0141591 [Medicago truncatula]
MYISCEFRVTSRACLYPNFSGIWVKEFNRRRPLYIKCGMSSWNLNDKFLLRPHPLQVELRWTLKNGSPNPTIENIHIYMVKHVSSSMQLTKETKEYFLYMQILVNKTVILKVCLKIGLCFKVHNMIFRRYVTAVEI